MWQIRLKTKIFFLILLIQLACSKSIIKLDDGDDEKKKFQSEAPEESLFKEIISKDKNPIVKRSGSGEPMSNPYLQSTGKDG